MGKYPPNYFNETCTTQLAYSRLFSSTRPSKFFSSENSKSLTNDWKAAVTILIITYNYFKYFCFFVKISRHCQHPNDVNILNLVINNVILFCRYCRYRNHRISDEDEINLKDISRRNLLMRITLCIRCI